MRIKKQVILSSQFEILNSRIVEQLTAPIFRGSVGQRPTLTGTEYVNTDRHGLEETMTITDQRPCRSVQVSVAVSEG